MDVPSCDRDIQQFIESIREMCRSCGGQIDSVLDQLSWTHNQAQNTQNKPKTVSCRFNPSHLVKGDNLEQHENVCQLTSNGFSREDMIIQRPGSFENLDPMKYLRNYRTQYPQDKIPPSSKFFYENLKNVYTCTIEKEKQNDILKAASQNSGRIHTDKEMPLTPDEAIVILTPAERLALYQHVVMEARSKGHPVSEVIDEAMMIDMTKLHKAAEKGEPDQKKMTPLEYRIAMRDYKRRRQSYRAKNVHITQKSYTEVIREVIENQTDHLREVIAEKELASSPHTIISRDRSMTHDRTEDMHSKRDIDSTRGGRKNGDNSIKHQLDNTYGSRKTGDYSIKHEIDNTRDSSKNGDYSIKHEIDNTCDNNKKWDGQTLDNKYEKDITRDNSNTTDHIMTQNSDQTHGTSKAQGDYDTSHQKQDRKSCEPSRSRGHSGSRGRSKSRDHSRSRSSSRSTKHSRRGSHSRHSSKERHRRHRSHKKHKHKHHHKH